VPPRETGEERGLRLVNLALLLPQVCFNLPHAVGGERPPHPFHVRGQRGTLRHQLVAQRETHLGEVARELRLLSGRRPVRLNLFEVRPELLHFGVGRNRSLLPASHGRRAEQGRQQDNRA
jgi:hypothetical protein